MAPQGRVWNPGEAGEVTVRVDLGLGIGDATLRWHAGDRLRRLRRRLLAVMQVQYYKRLWDRNAGGRH